MEYHVHPADPTLQPEKKSETSQSRRPRALKNVKELDSTADLPDFVPGVYNAIVSYDKKKLSPLLKKLGIVEDNRRVGKDSRDGKQAKKKELAMLMIPTKPTAKNPRAKADLKKPRSKKPKVVLSNDEMESSSDEGSCSDQGSSSDTDSSADSGSEEEMPRKRRLVVIYSSDGDNE